MSDEEETDGFEEAMKHDEEPETVDLEKVAEAIAGAQEKIRQAVANVKAKQDERDRKKKSWEDSEQAVTAAKEAVTTARREAAAHLLGTAGLELPEDEQASAPATVTEKRTRGNPRKVTTDQVLKIVEQEKDTVVRKHKGATVPKIVEALGTNRANVEEALSTLKGEGKVDFTGDGTTKRWIPKKK
jgi:hypothetical protein